MKIRLFIVLSIIALSSQGIGLSFKQVAYFSSGILDGEGYIKGLDINHDGFQDLAFSTWMFRGDSLRVVYYGYRPFNRYVFQDSAQPPYSRWSLFWEIGDLDGDSLMDLIVQNRDTTINNFIKVLEPASYWTLPKMTAWSWRYEYFGGGVQPMYITDLDRDGLKEILTGDEQVVYVFEHRGDNQYVKVFSDTSKPASSTPPFAVGDFDGDGQMEFVRGTYGGPPGYYIYECTGDDQYQVVWMGGVPASNKIDGVTGPDLDGDGKLEFVFGSLRTGSITPWKACLWIYESTGNNQYQLIFSDSVPVPNRGHYTCRSDCGDVDRDGRVELVWAIDRDWMVYKSPGDNQFVRVYSAYGDNGHVDTNIHIHDMNGNGYPEIIESGGGDAIRVYGETHIWEVETVRLDYPNGGETLYGDSLAVIRWRNVDPFQADSFSLFYSSDSGLTYSPVAHGIPGSDSAYTWTVPETYSDDCFVMLWAYQNATGWDFSDAPFMILPGSGVSDHPPSTIHHSLLPLRVSPNPFITYAQAPGYEKSSFALYDVSGRKVGVYKGDRIGVGLSAGIYFLKPEGRDAKPLRIVKLR